MAVRLQMPVRIVQSKQNARLKELRRALAPPGRDRRQGLAGIEGPNLLEEACAAGSHVTLRLCRRGRASDLLDGVRASRRDRDSARSAAAARFRAATPKRHSPSPPWSSRPTGPGPTCSTDAERSAPLILVLAGIQDPRQPGHDSPLRRGLRRDRHRAPARHRQRVESQGRARLRRQRLPRAADRDHEPTKCFDQPARGRQSGFLRQPSAPPQPADLVDLTGPVALLIGNEGNGVPDDLAARADGQSRFPAPARSRASTPRSPPACCSTKHRGSERRSQRTVRTARSAR